MIVVLLAAGLLWLLVVYGEVVERDLRRAGMPGGGAPSWARPGCLVPVSVAVVITANSQVLRQKDLHLKPHLSALREEEREECKDILRYEDMKQLTGRIPFIYQY